jgi:hypothetical protein
MQYTHTILLALAASAATAGPIVINDSSRIAPAETLGDAGFDFGEVFDISNGVIAAALPLSFTPPNPSDHAGEVLLIDADSGLALRRLIPQQSARSTSVLHVAFDGDTVAVIKGNGSAETRRLFVFDATTGAQRFEILPDAEDQYPGLYGRAVAVGDGVVAVGHPQYDVVSVDPQEALDKVELYDAVTGASLGELESNIPDIAEYFGNEICIHSGRIAVSAFQGPFGADGSAERVVVFDLATQQELFVINPPAGVTDDANFGESVAMNDDYIVVAATLDDPNGPNSGSVFVFDAADGAYLHTLDIGATPNLNVLERDLSIQVDISDTGTIVVSMMGGTTRGASVHDAFTGVRTATLVPNPIPGGSDANQQFGFSSAIDGESIYVSDPGLLIDTDRVESIFRFDPPILIAQQPQDLVVDSAGQDFFMQIVASNASSYQWFFDGQPISDGPSYTGSDTSVLVITSGPEVEGQYSIEVASAGFGSVISDPAYFVYRGESGFECRADFTGDEMLDIFDVFGFLDAFNMGCP